MIPAKGPGHGITNSELGAPRAQSPGEDQLPRLDQAVIAGLLSSVEQHDGEWGQWEHGSGFPHVNYVDIVDRVWRALRQQGMIVPFDWPTWARETGISDPAVAKTFLHSASLEDCRRLLTAYNRAERFSDGTWLGMFEASVMTAVLRRLRDLAGETATR